MKARDRELDLFRPPTREERLRALATSWRERATSCGHEGRLASALTLQEAAADLDGLLDELGIPPAPPENESRDYDVRERQAGAHLEDRPLLGSDT